MDIIFTYLSYIIVSKIQIPEKAKHKRFFIPTEPAHVRLFIRVLEGIVHNSREYGNYYNQEKHEDKDKLANCQQILGIVLIR